MAITFASYICSDAEFVLTNTREQTRGSPRRDLPLLGIAGAFLREFYPLVVRERERLPEPAEVYQAMARVYSSLSRPSNEVESRIRGMQMLEHDFALQDLYSPPPVEDDFHISDLFEWPFVMQFSPMEEVRGPWHGLSFWFLLEVLALRRAVAQWLTPQPAGSRGRYLPPLDVVARDLQESNQLRTRPRLLDISDEYSSFLEKALADASLRNARVWLKVKYMPRAFEWRTQQVGVRFPAMMSIVDQRSSRKSVFNRVPAHSYKAAGLLPLAWAEIMWAIESGTYAHTCDVCGGVLALHRPYNRAVYICSSECERKRKIERMGGLEAFRTYNREAQKKYRERMRARKERTQNAEEES